MFLVQYVRVLFWEGEAEMKTVTVAELRGDIDNLLEEILVTGIPLDVKMGDRRLRTAPVEPVDKFSDMEFRPDVINGAPEDLVHIEWEYKLDGSLGSQGVDK